MQVSHIKTLRKLLLALIVFVVLAVLFNYVQTWRRRARMVAKTAKILSTELIRSAESIEYSEHEHGVVRFRIRAEKLLETRQGKNFLQDIEAFDFNTDGSVRNQIRSHKAEYDRDHKAASFWGDVRIRIGEGLELRTESLQYDLDTNLGRTDDRVELISQQSTGTARGVQYDNVRKTLDLRSQLNFLLRRSLRDPDGSLRIQNVRAISERGFFSEGAQIIRFEGNAHLDSETDLLSGQVIEATFSSDTRQITSLSCEGAAVYESKDPANSRAMQGDRITFGISRPTGALERIDVLRRAVFTSRSQDSVLGLRASEIHVDLDLAKGTPRRIQGRGQVQLQIRRESQETAIAGENLDFVFAEDREAIERLRVWGGARMVSRSAAESGSEELQAEEIAISFRSLSGRTAPQELQAEKSVQWKTAPPKSKPDGSPAPGRVLTAASLKMRYAENGDFLETGKAEGKVTITGIPVGDTARSEIRRLEADRVRFHFYPGGNRLKRVEAENHVSVFYHKPADPASQRSAEQFQTSSSEMRCAFREEDGSAVNFSQWGDFVYQDSSRKATAGRCDYEADTEVLVLKDSPRIIDDNGSSAGEWMEYDRKKHMLTVHNRVQTSLRPREGETSTPFGSSSVSRAPSVVTANLMQYWEENARARYSGAVQLLSEDGQLQARVLEIYNNGDQVEAEGEIRHLVLRAEGPRESKSGPDPKPTTKMDRKKDQQISRAVIQSARMRYFKEQNSIHYSGKVIFTSEDAWMSSESFDAVLAPDGRAIERAAARGGVLTRQAGREVKGELADYYLTPGKFVVTGNPAEIMDPARGKSLARRLTFFTADDRVLLENH